MPPKRTPVKGAKDATPKSKKDKTPRVIVPEVIARPRDSSVESTAPSAPTENDIDNAENMTRHQRFGMFGHLIK